MLRAIARYMKPEIHITAADQLREGPATLEGVAQNPDEVLTTPHKSTRCIVYHYKAFRVVRTRSSMSEQVLRESVVYSPFELALDGGSVRAVPTSSEEPVSADEHRSLLSQGIEGFIVTEDPISVGARVALKGMVVREGDGYVVRFKELHTLKGEAAGDGGGRAARRKKKRKSR